MVSTNLPYPLTKQQVTTALGYTPVGGQGVNLLTNNESEWANEGISMITGDADTVNKNRLRTKEKIPVQENQKYTLSIFNTGDAIYQCMVYFYRSNETFISIFGDWKEFPFVFETKNESAYCMIAIRYKEEKPMETTILNSVKIKLEHGIVTDPVWTPAPEDVVVRSEPPTSLNLIFPKNAGAHNSVFRGNDLGTSVTEAQYAAINNGSFDDIFVGDYWTINNTVYRVAGLDIFLHVGDTELKTHHAVIVPDNPMYTGKMNETNTTAKAYQGSEMKTTGLDTALTTIKTAFGDSHVISHKVLLANAVSGDNPSGWTWQSTEIDLMTERQVYGSPAWGQAQHNGYDANMQYSRFPLFSLAPEFITNRVWYWLQDVRSASTFCYVDSDGHAGTGHASYSGGVRPYFLIG